MSDKLNTIIQADCLEYLKSLPDGCVDLVLIDEPYMLFKGHKIEEGYNLDIAKQVRIEAMRVLKKDGWFLFLRRRSTFTKKYITLKNVKILLDIAMYIIIIYIIQWEWFIGVNAIRRCALLLKCSHNY